MRRGLHWHFRGKRFCSRHAASCTCGFSHAHAHAHVHVRVWCARACVCVCRTQCLLVITSLVMPQSSELGPARWVVSGRFWCRPPRRRRETRRSHPPPSAAYSVAARSPYFSSSPRLRAALSLYIRFNIPSCENNYLQPVISGVLVIRQIRPARKLNQDARAPPAPPRAAAAGRAADARHQRGASPWGAWSCTWQRV